jgi:uncharacterized protein (TIGR02301 family)
MLRPRGCDGAETPLQSRLRYFSRCAVLSALTFAAVVSPLAAGSARYEQNLLRLSEILGAMHYLQQICTSFTSETWRDQMITLIEAEKARGDKEARLTLGFNRGYRKYQEWFTSCTPGADVEIERFTQEGSELSTWLARNRR